MTLALTCGNHLKKDFRVIDIRAHVKEKTRKHNELVYLSLRGAISTAELTTSWLGVIQRLLQWNTNRILETLIDCNRFHSAPEDVESISK